MSVLLSYSILYKKEIAVIVYRSQIHLGYQWSEKVFPGQRQAEADYARMCMPSQ